jgi:hypothetical protein
MLDPLERVFYVMVLSSVLGCVVKPAQASQLLANAKLFFLSYPRSLLLGAYLYY